MKKSLILSLLLTIFYSLGAVEVQIENSILLKSEHNYSTKDKYKNINRMEIETQLYLSNWFTFEFFPNIEFDLKEQSSVEIEKLSTSILLLDGLFSFEVGKFLPEYGVGYTKKNPTDLIGKVSDYKSRSLASAFAYTDFATLEFTFGPSSSPLDTEVLDSIYLGRVSKMVEIHSVNFVYMFSVNPYVGLSYSSQIGETIIPYVESVYRFNNEYLNLLGGISWSPYFMNWTVYLEFMYNSLGLNRNDWLNLKPQMLGNIDFMNSSEYYFISHFKQSDMERFFNTLKVDGTLIATYPTGLYGELEADFEVLDRLNLGLSVGGVVYSEDKSEFSYLDNNITFGLSVSCSY